MKSIIILGRQPKIGLAELESLYGSSNFKYIRNDVAASSLKFEQFNFDRIGGSIKLAEIIADIPQKNLRQYLLNDLALFEQITGKFNFGFSFYGDALKIKDINKLAIELKNKLQKSGLKARYVPNKTLNLNSAQVWHNKLIGEKGFELILVENNERVIIATTKKVQDIFAYSKRDQNRPKRDARVGMLPPKLAQIIINLAISDVKIDHKQTLLDPFCGTGVILQEALLMGYSVIGSDIDQRMVDYAITNIDWLISHKKITGNYKIQVKDATETTWEAPSFIATETYLGLAYSTKPNPNKLEENILNTDNIIYKFLKNLYKQTKPGTRICIALPAWFTDHAVKHLPTLDRLEELGYNRIAFEFATQSDLIYHRADQIVGRELVILVRK